jgi:LCP family protein required for cell wall assembly
MTSRDRRPQATASARTRRLRDAARREEELRAQGLDPFALERASLAATSRSAPAGAARERRRVPIKAVLLIGLLLLLTIATVGGILLWGRVSAFNASVSTASAASSALWGPLGGEERVNIALFGYGGEEHKSGNFLADSIQILSIDPAMNKTSVIPIPRDFWVEGLAQIPDNGKINEAFAIGHARGGIEEAARLTTEVLSEVTGLEIDHWMAIDFAGFKEVIDAVGGITVKNARSFRYTWSEALWRNGRYPDGRFRQGEIELTGEEALAYARARYTNKEEESSDFARSNRQAKVLGGLRKKLGSGGFGSIGPGLAMMDALQGKMKTDLSAFDLFLLSSHIDPDRRIRLGEGQILEATTNTIGQYILVVIGRDDPTDYRPLHRYIADELAKPFRRPGASPS